MKLITFCTLCFISNILFISSSHAQVLKAKSFKLEYEAYESSTFVLTNGSIYDTEVKPKVLSLKLEFDNQFIHTEFNYKVDIYRIESKKDYQNEDLHYFKTICLTDSIVYKNDVLYFTDGLNIEQLFNYEISDFFNSKGFKIIFYAYKKYSILKRIQNYFLCLQKIFYIYR
ncbi:MAG: hypothetical protein AAGI07_05700 [Bacteroidota bacterium]